MPEACSAVPYTQYTYCMATTRDVADLFVLHLYSERHRSAWDEWSRRQGGGNKGNRRRGRKRARLHSGDCWCWYPQQISREEWQTYLEILAKTQLGASSDVGGRIGDASRRSANAMTTKRHAVQTRTGVMPLTPFQFPPTCLELRSKPDFVFASAPVFSGLDFSVGQCRPAKGGNTASFMGCLAIGVELKLCLQNLAMV
ncbi:hypothetical protein B0H10DRAFT_2190102 [Mycena sp. CBHHK59/15]|nr:hypothetical protein B0H10DRAFT_2190102 [Mycena sp. CBHHK59/15]